MEELISSNLTHEDDQWILAGASIYEIDLIWIYVYK
jgi:hypothetical protein